MYLLYCPPNYKLLKWNCWKFWSREMKYHHSSVVESKSFHHSWLGFASSLVMKWFWFNSRLVMIFHFSTPEFSAIVHICRVRPKGFFLFRPKPKLAEIAIFLFGRNRYRNRKKNSVSAETECRNRKEYSCKYYYFWQRGKFFLFKISFKYCPQRLQK